MYSRQLFTFVNVVEQGSFSKAADRLYLTTVSVMNQINALEMRIGVKLLDRSHKGITLTEAGTVIYENAKKIIRESDEAVKLARDTVSGEQSIIRVGSSLLYPCDILVGFWNLYMTMYPQYKIRVIPFQDDHLTILDKLSKLGDDYDFIAGPCDSLAFRDICSIFEWDDYDLCYAIPRTHRLASRDIIRKGDLDGETVMMVQSGDSPILTDLREHIIKEHPAIKLVDGPTYYDIDVFNECVEHNWCLLSLSSWNNVHPSMVTIPAEWDRTMRYGLMYAKKPSRKVSGFIDIIRGIRSGTI